MAGNWWINIRAMRLGVCVGAIERQRKKRERVRGQWLECDWTASQNVWLHSRFVPWDHSCVRCGIDWEQLFCSLFSSYRRWHCLHSGDGQRGTLLSLNSVCSLRVGTKGPQTQQYSTSILGIGREGRGRRCQTEWDWWQDITRSWSRPSRTHGAINYTGCGVLQWTQNIIGKCNLLCLSVEVRSDKNRVEIT